MGLITCIEQWMSDVIMVHNSYNGSGSIFWITCLYEHPYNPDQKVFFNWKYKKMSLNVDTEQKKGNRLYFKI